MTMYWWVVVLCVAVMAVGQVLFKLVAVNYNQSGSLSDPKVFGVLAVAGALYVLSTGMWIWALRHVELSKAYPVFALGFVLVPLAGAWLFGEQLSLKFAVGIVLIVVGVALTSS